MTMRRALLVVLVTMGACGGDGGSEQMMAAAPAFVGSWMASLSTSCVMGAKLRADGTYELDTLCTLSDGSVGDSVVRGNWAEPNDHQLALTPKEATCSGEVPTAPSWSVNGTTLVLEFSDARLVFQAVTGTGSASGVVTLGCFASGQFTAGPIKPL